MSIERVNSRFERILVDMDNVDAKSNDLRLVKNLFIELRDSELASGKVSVEFAADSERLFNETLQQWKSLEAEATNRFPGFGRGALNHLVYSEDVDICKRYGELVRSVQRLQLLLNVFGGRKWVEIRKKDLRIRLGESERNFPRRLKEIEHRMTDNRQVIAVPEDWLATI